MSRLINNKTKSITTTINNSNNTTDKKPTSNNDKLDNISLEQLHILINNSTIQLNDIQQNKNKIIHEYNILNNMIDTKRNKYNELKDQTYLLSNDIDNTIEQHNNTIQTYMNKVLHMNYEYNETNKTNNNILDNKLHELHANSLITKDDFDKRKNELIDRLQQDYIKYNNEINRIKELESKELIKLNENFESNYKLYENKLNDKIKQCESNLILNNKIIINEINNNKNNHINKLIEQHNIAIENNKQYYYSITTDQLSLIYMLNEQLNNIKQNIHNNEIKIKNLNDKIKIDIIPLKETENTINELQAKLINSNKIKQNLKNNKIRLNNLIKQYNNNQQQYNELIDKYKELELQRDILLSTYNDSLHTIRSKNNKLANNIEHNIDELNNDFENKKLTFTQILNNSNIDSKIIENVTHKLDILLNDKNQMIDNIKYEIQKQNNIINKDKQYYTNILKQNNVDVDNTQFDTNVQS